ncbi:MAG: methyltransferase family protein [Desulfotomaculales bacterium]
MLFLGIIGLALLLIYDLASLKKVKKRYVLAAGGYLTHALAIFLALFRDRNLLLPEWTAWPGAVLALAGLGWLCYCLFLFPPIKKTYTETKKMVLTDEGPYSLARHPGFFGYAALITGLVFLSGSSYLLQAGFLWTLLDLLHIFIQDKLLFPRLFSEYIEYRQKTPMIFPNRESLRRFLQTTTFSRVLPKAYRGG